MPKNLKLKIKNAQLAEAFNINKLKAAAAAPQKKEAKEEPNAKKKTPKKTVKKAIENEHIEEKKAVSTTEEEKTKVVKKAVPLEEKVQAKEEKKAEEPKKAKAPPEKKEAKPPTTAKEKKKEPEVEKKPFKKTAPTEFRDMKGARRPEQQRAFDGRDRQGLREVEEGSWRRRRPRGKFKRVTPPEEIIRPNELLVKIPITVKDLAQEMKRKASELISKLFMQGLTLTINDYLDDETTVQLLGEEFGCTITIDVREEKRLRITDKTIAEEISETPPEKLKPRPPVIAFMGHVDHGKTSLIDAIRKSDIISHEAGAITQHIGAFKTHTENGELTILDTPGHEAFSEMRKRGATVTDVVILVIAGDEGMKPQTEEAMAKAVEANAPIIVAINKSDKPGFNPENVYRQLADHNLLPEAWGGATITVNCSAIKGEGIKDLLDMILIQTEMLELKANPNSRARGTVIESELHKGLGITATLLIQNGTLKTGDALVIDQIYGRIKTLHDENEKSLTTAPPSTPVKITGLSGLPLAGAEFIVVESEKEAKKLAEERGVGRQRELLKLSKKGELETLLEEQAERQVKKNLNIILRADVQGSLEAIKSSLRKLPSDKVEINIISSGVGDISESDIDLSSISDAIIIGFHTKIEAHAEPIRKQKKVTVIIHDVIYHLIDDVKAKMTSLLDKIREEKLAGTALVKETFKSSQLGVIAGCIVQEGTIHRNHYAKLFRGEDLIWEGEISSLKRVKEDVKEVGKGLECGILLNNFDQMQPEDEIKSYEIHYKSQSL